MLNCIKVHISTMNSACLTIFMIREWLSTALHFIVLDDWYHTCCLALPLWESWSANTHAPLGTSNHLSCLPKKTFNDSWATVETVQSHTSSLSPKAFQYTICSYHVALVDGTAYHLRMECCAVHRIISLAGPGPIPTYIIAQPLHVEERVW